MVRIDDAPRFEWRGVMLDVARHFFSVTEVQRVIELASRYKLNRVHLHLTDDQGWRIHIDSWPDLTAIGSMMDASGGPGGFYSKDDYREIVRVRGGAVRDDRSGDRHAGPYQRGAGVVRRAQRGRRADRSRTLHSFWVELAVDRWSRDAELRRRRPDRAGGDDAGTVHPHRRRRGACYAARGVRRVHGRGARHPGRPRQDHDRLGRDRGSGDRAALHRPVLACRGSRPRRPRARRFDHLVAGGDRLPRSEVRSVDSDRPRLGRLHRGRGCVFLGSDPARHPRAGRARGRGAAVDRDGRQSR